MSINRRKFLSASVATATATSVALAGQRPAAHADDQTTSTHHPNPIAISSYSFWRYNDATKLPIERCIDLASEMGFDGFEVLHVQMQDESNGYLQKLKRRVCQWNVVVRLFDPSGICQSRSGSPQKKH